MSRQPVDHRFEDSGPVAAPERIALLDALRGFALFGILLVNIAGFSQPFQSFRLPVDAAQPWYDLAASVVVTVLAEGKFYPLFSLLFGLGFALQIERARARALPWRSRYLRRLLVLFAIGFVHGVFIWAGDILMLYAVVGLVLMLFGGASPRAILGWIVAIGAAFLLTVTAAFAVLDIAAGSTSASVVLGEEAAAEAAALEEEIGAVQHVYATGGFAEITAQRIDDLAFLLSDTLFLGPNVLFYFLLGLYFGKRRIFADPAGQAALFSRWWRTGVAIGLPLSLGYALTQFAFDPFASGWIDWWSFVTFLAGGLALSLGYAGAFSLLWLQPPARKRLELLAPVGRMALTNYLLQSLAATLIFYGYGLGWFGQIAPAAGLMIAIAIYACQVPLSHWWLRRYRFGPAEWLWRSLTYGRAQAMRLR